MGGENGEVLGVKKSVVTEIGRKQSFTSAEEERKSVNRLRSPSPYGYGRDHSWSRMKNRPVERGETVGDRKQSFASAEEQRKSVNRLRSPSPYGQGRDHSRSRVRDRTLERGEGRERKTSFTSVEEQRRSVNRLRSPSPCKSRCLSPGNVGAAGRHGRDHSRSRVGDWTVERGETVSPGSGATPPYGREHSRSRLGDSRTVERGETLGDRKHKFASVEEQRRSVNRLRSPSPCGHRCLSPGHSTSTHGGKASPGSAGKWGEARRAQDKPPVAGRKGGIVGGGG